MLFLLDNYLLIVFCRYLLGDEMLLVLIVKRNLFQRNRLVNLPAHEASYSS